MAVLRRVGAAAPGAHPIYGYLQGRHISDGKRIDNSVRIVRQGKVTTVSLYQP